MTVGLWHHQLMKHTALIGKENEGKNNVAVGMDTVF